MYAWEPSFEDQILKIRNKEMNVLKQTAYLNSATSFIWSCAPFLVSYVFILLIHLYTYQIKHQVSYLLELKKCI